jgi:hypothetical protein
MLHVGPSSTVASTRATAAGHATKKPTEHAFVRQQCATIKAQGAAARRSAPDIRERAQAGLQQSAQRLREFTRSNDRGKPPVIGESEADGSQPTATRSSKKSCSLTSRLCRTCTRGEGQCITDGAGSRAGADRPPRGPRRPAELRSELAEYVDDLDTGDIVHVWLWCPEYENHLEPPEVEE